VFRVVIIVVLLAFLGVGCSNTAGDTPTTGPDTDFSASPLATPANTTIDSPVSTPEPTFIPTPLPAPGDGLGSVTGRLLDRETGDTITGVAVYLGDIGDVIMIQQNSSPHVISDAEGYFALLDVEPKEYAIVLWTPHSSSVPSAPDGSPYSVKVEAGEVTDMGELRVVRP
jgi:hypothetical protein